MRRIFFDLSIYFDYFYYSFSFRFIRLFYDDIVVRSLYEQYRVNIICWEGKETEGKGRIHTGLKIYEI